MENEKLIELVRKNEVLYNLSSKDYKNVIKKDEIWADIGKEINMAVDSCKKRWKSIRDSYRRHKKNSQSASGSRASSSTCKYKYMESLNFLAACTDSRETVGNFTPCATEQFDEDLMDGLMNDSTLSGIDEIVTTSLHDTSTPEAVKKKSVRKNKKANTEITKIFSETMMKCMKTVESIASSDNDSDLTTTVFTTLAKQVLQANLPPQRARLIERKVTRLVNDEIENYEIETNLGN